MSSQLIQFSYRWPVVVTDYVADIRKIFEVTDLDRVIWVLSWVLVRRP